MASVTPHAGPDDNSEVPTEPSDHRFHRYVVVCFLRLERAALEAKGSEGALMLQHPLYSQDRNQNERERLDGILTTETPLLSRRTYYYMCPRNRFCRYLVMLSVIVLLAAFLSEYYIIILGAWTREDLSIKSVLRLDVFALLVFLSFWPAAPIHTALGYFSQDASIEECRENTEKLVLDRGSRHLSTFSVVMILLKSSFQLSSFVFRKRDVGLSDAMYVLYIPFAALLILLHSITVMGHLLLIALALRAIVARLKELDIDIGTQMDDAHQQTNDPSDSPDYYAILKRWSTSFDRLGQDMRQLSDRFGYRMVLALALFLLATTSIISTIWQSSEENRTVFETVVLLVNYVTEASMLMMAISSVCYPVTMSTQYIGPKLVVMAVESQEWTPDDRISRTLQLLANGFLLAPIEMTVGNFELLPSVSNTAAGIVVGLFFVALGYNSPF